MTPVVQTRFTTIAKRVKVFLTQTGYLCAIDLGPAVVGVIFICAALVGCGGGGSSAKTTATATQTNMTVAASTYSMQSLPLSGLVTNHTATSITYATDGVGFLVLLGNFTYPSSISSTATTVLANLSGVTGTITGIGQYGATQALQMSITGLSISASKFEGYIESVDYYSLWQLMVPSTGLYISTVATITCPNPSAGGVGQSFVTTANQNIAPSLAKCSK